MIPNPTRGTRLEIAVWFVAPPDERPDVDNVLKPILDALKGIVYIDDSQVRSVSVTAIPSGEPFGVQFGTDRFSRLLEEKEFLINIYATGPMFRLSP